MTTRRAAIGALAVALAAIGARRLDYLESQTAIARTSRDSRWYDFTARHAQLLDDQSLGHWPTLSESDLNNRHVLDLREFDAIGDLAVIRSKRILARTEAWELSQERPELRNDVGYPTLAVENLRGNSPRYYLYYAIHDVASGIGLATADRLGGPYRKVRGSEPFADSRILYPPARPRLTSHLSSPIVVWNADKGLWHLYFHYYSNQFDEGLGHQNTALATSRNLLDWDVLTGSDGDFLAVLPVTRELWMNSQSTYHAIQRLPNGLWLAFLRGTGVTIIDGKPVGQPTALGFAVSIDGVRWSLVPGSPQFPALPHRPEGDVIRRPGFIARMRDRYLVCWSEGIERPGAPRHHYAYTRDFQSFSAPVAGPVFPVEDGAICPWREGDRIYLLSGPWLHELGKKAA